MLSLAVVLASFAAGMGCVGYEPGLSVRVAFAPVMQHEGAVLDVERAELVACGEGGHHHHHALLRWLGPSRAEAQHHHASALVIDTPTHVDLSSGGELGDVFSPPPGCYDRIRFVLLGEIDAVETTLTPALELDGTTRDSVVTLDVPVHDGRAVLADASRR